VEEEQEEEEVEEETRVWATERAMWSFALDVTRAPGM
jgi:hypothetical protein